MKKSEKAIFVENLTEELKSAKSVIIVNYSGLNVKSQQELKRRLKEAGAKMIVVKNTLLKRAGDAAKIDEEILSDTVLQGQTAVIVAGGDPLAPLSVLGKFTKEFEVPQMKVGIVDGRIQDAEALTRLSNLPGRDALLGQLLGVLIGPPYGLVGTLNANSQKLLFILNEKAKGGDLYGKRKVEQREIRLWRKII